MKINFYIRNSISLWKIITQICLKTNLKFGKFTSSSNSTLKEYKIIEKMIIFQFIGESFLGIKYYRIKLN